MRCKNLQQVFEVQSFGLDTIVSATPLLCCH